MTTFSPQPKKASQAQDRVAMKKVREQAERDFKLQVWVRDQARCRKCGRKVIKSMVREMARGEVNHCHGRLGFLRYEVKCALLVCLNCHEQLTGRVAEKWIVEGTKFWKPKSPNLSTPWQLYIDTRAPVTFVRVA